MIFEPLSAERKQRGEFLARVILCRLVGTIDQQLARAKRKLAGCTGRIQELGPGYPGEGGNLGSIKGRHGHAFHQEL